MAIAINHIFDSKNIHLNPGIIESIVENQDKGHQHIFFVSVLGAENKALEMQVYENLKARKYNVTFLKSYKDYLKVFLGLQRPIILHGLISPLKKQFILFIMVYILARRKLGMVNLVAWGERDFAGNIANLPFLNHVYRRIVYSFNRVLTLSYGDKLAYENLYRRPSTWISYLVVNKNINPSLSNLSDTQKIMVSHSGWCHNKHTHTFNLIRTKVKEDVEIICPLAYGDQNYIDEVITVGESLFGNRFKYFTKLKDKADYEKMLSTVSVFITSAQIQTGLYTITSCLANGCKVYCRGNLFQTLTEVGFIVFEIENFEDMSFDEFFFFSEPDREHNKKMYFEKYKDINRLRQIWREIFEGS